MAVSTGPLLGRDEEIVVLRGVIDGARRGIGGIAVIEGEPGIGKTRLLNEARSIALAEGFQVLSATSDGAEQTTPFATLTRLLGDQLDLAGLRSIRDASVPATRFRVVESAGAHVEALAARTPVLIAVDDLQWTDESSLVALRSIASRVSGLPVAMIVTQRAGQSVMELHALIDQLIRLEARLVSLGALDEIAVAALAGSVLGRAPAEALLERLRGAAGNPLYVREYVQAMADESTAIEPGAIEIVPMTFRRNVLRRIEQLPANVRDALRMGSVLGTAFDPEDLRAVLRWSALELVPVVEQAVSAGWIEERGRQLAFRHPLVRDAVYQNIPAGVRHDLHREVWHRLDEAGTDGLVVAHHVLLAASSTDPEGASWLHRAASDAMATAPAVAAQLLERARSLLVPSSRAARAIAKDLAIAYAWAGRFAESESLCRAVLADQIDGRDELDLRSGLLRALTWQGHAAQALDEVGLRPTEVVEGPEAAMLAGETALAALLSYNFPRAIPAAALAEELARAHEIDTSMCQALSVRVWVSAFVGQPAAAVELAHEALRIADGSPDGVAHGAHPSFFIGMPLVMLDRLDEADRHLQRGRRIAADRGLVWALPLFHSHLGAMKFVAGEWDAAVAEIEGGLAIADELGSSQGILGAAAGWLTAMHVHRGDLDSADRVVAEAVARAGEAASRMPLLNWGRALVHEARGDLDPALLLLQEAFDVLTAGGGQADPWSAMTLVRLCVRSGDLDRARALVPALEQQADTIGTAFTRAQALRSRGLALGDVDALVEATTAYRSCPRPHEHAAGCEDAGQALADRGLIDDGVNLLEEALGLYDELGAARDAARVRSTLRRHGVRRAGTRRTARATSGWESLTQTEHKVAELVAKRLSNPEVAERLFISRHTVESHLKHIFQKLGVSSRVELAAAAIDGR